MELTKECLEEIALCAREVDTGTLTITIQSRPEDKKAFRFKCEYEKRYTVNRTGRSAFPTEMSGKTGPADKYS
jgi:hypothetical protein